MLIFFNRIHCLCGKTLPVFDPMTTFLGLCLWSWFCIILGKNSKSRCSVYPPVLIDAIVVKFVEQCTSA